MKKQITRVLNGMPTQDGAGVNLTRAIGQPALRNLDPFLMLDEIRSDNPDDYIAGFPAHPHKGFETLSYMIQGSMEHNDSTGGHGLITSGGVQYMTAGKGIIHSETPKQDSGMLFGFQLWLNLPAKDKLQQPKYIDIPKKDIPVLNGTEDIGADATIKVIAGKFNGMGAEGPVVRSDIEAEIYDVTLNKGSLSTNIHNDKRGFIYVYHGKLEINGQVVTAKQIATLGEGEAIDLVALEESGFLLLAGLPINEPIIQYGPFVMNSMSEIDTALRDYQSGNFV